MIMADEPSVIGVCFCGLCGPRVARCAAATHLRSMALTVTPPLQEAPRYVNRSAAVMLLMPRPAADSTQTAPPLVVSSRRAGGGDSSAKGTAAACCTAPPSASIARKKSSAPTAGNERGMTVRASASATDGTNERVGGRNGRRSFRRGGCGQSQSQWSGSPCDPTLQRQWARIGIGWQPASMSK